MYFEAESAYKYCTTIAQHSFMPGGHDSQNGPHYEADTFLGLQAGRRTQFSEAIQFFEPGKLAIPIQPFFHLTLV